MTTLVTPAPAPTSAWAWATSTLPSVLLMVWRAALVVRLLERRRLVVVLRETVGRWAIRTRTGELCSVNEGWSIARDASRIKRVRVGHGHGRLQLVGLRWHGLRHIIVVGTITIGILL